jgi:DNA-directed RNA polymerase specialized sigma54-like protein
MTTMRLLLQQGKRLVVTPALQQAIQLLQLKAGVAGVGAVTIR